MQIRAAGCPYVLVVLASLLVTGCTLGGGVIHLPSTEIEADIIDPEFVAFVEDLVAEGAEVDIVCIVRFDHLLSEEQQGELAELALILKGSRRDTWFIRAPVATVAALFEDDHVAWMGGYKDEYKLGRRADTIGEEKRWMHVVSFAGNYPEFHEDMVGIGIDDIRYDSVLGEYHVYVNGEQRDQLIELWWVREIYKAGGRGLGRMWGW